MSSKSRANYFSERRGVLKMVSVMVEKESLDALDSKLASEGITRAQWVRQCISKELGGFQVPTYISAACPKCKKTAQTKEAIEEFFGWRVVNARTIPQSWCRECRSK